MKSDEAPSVNCEVTLLLERDCEVTQQIQLFRSCYQILKLLHSFFAKCRSEAIEGLCLGAVHVGTCVGQQWSRIGKTSEREALHVTHTQPILEVTLISKQASAREQTLDERPHTFKADTWIIEVPGKIFRGSNIFRN